MALPSLSEGPVVPKLVFSFHPDWKSGIRSSLVLRELVSALGVVLCPPLDMKPSIKLQFLVHLREVRTIVRGQVRSWGKDDIILLGKTLEE